MMIYAYQGSFKGQVGSGTTAAAKRLHARENAMGGGGWTQCKVFEGEIGEDKSLFVGESGRVTRG